MLRYGVPVKVEAGKVTETVHLVDWQRGIQARENTIKAAMLPLLENEDEVERIFLIIRAQVEY